MVKFTKKISKKAGLPPGSLVHIGERKTEKPRIRVIAYDEEHIEEKDIESLEESFASRPEPAVTWLNIDGMHQVDLIETLGKAFRLHPLALEDVLNTDQRPKLDDYEEHICVILKMLTYNDKDNQLKVEQISLIVGQGFVISLQESEGDVFDPVRERLRRAKGRIRKMGSDYLAYSLVDAIVDNYFVVLERIGEEIESLFIPLTFIAGVYGMNFRYMPELEWRAGYAFAWLVMIAVGVTLLIYFRRKKWI